MTVDELRAKLGEYPGDLIVVADWEGTANGFYDDCFEVKGNKLRIWAESVSNGHQDPSLYEDE